MIIRCYPRHFVGSLIQPLCYLRCYEILSILMWIKVNYNQNTLTCLKFLNFTKFDQKNFSKLFGKVKIIQAPAAFELMTFRFVNITL